MIRKGEFWSALGVLFGVLGPALAGSGIRPVHADEGKPPAWLSAITSANEVERDAAKAQALEERRSRIEGLLAILRRPVAKGEPFFITSTARNTAISLLGAMRAKEAVPDLLQWLRMKEGQSGAVVNPAPVAISLAGRALIEIGNPSVPPVLKIIAEKGCSSARNRESTTETRAGITHVWFKDDPTYKVSPVGDQCLRILVEIMTTGGVEDALQRALKAETDPVKKENIESAIKLLRFRWQREKGEADQTDREGGGQVGTGRERPDARGEGK